MMEISMDPLSQQMQGLGLTEQQIKLFDTEQQATIADLREWAIECGQEKPAFHVSVDFDVTKAEDAITNERDRLIKRKEFQQKQKMEADSGDQKEVTIKEAGGKFFPPTAMVWTTVKATGMKEIFFEVTGNYPEEEEEEFLCKAEAKSFNLWDGGECGDHKEKPLLDF